MLVRLSVARAVQLFALCWLWLFAIAAHADSALDVSTPPAGERLGRNIALLEDASGASTIEQVATAPMYGAFERADEDAPALGFSKSAHWVRLEVKNSSSLARTWLLELAYPTLDDVRLYLPRASGGYELKHTGDLLPFSERDLDARTFVFRIEEPAHSQRTLYLRVRTSGPVNLPLRAWSYESFQEHQNRELPLMWMFYGLLFVMAVYNGFVYLSIRQREYFYYCLYALGFLGTQASLSGHAFQYLVPNQPWLANRLLALLLGLTLLFATRFIIRFLALREALPFAYHAMHWGGLAGGLCGLYALVGSYTLSLKAQIAIGLPLNWVMLAATVILVRRRYRPALFYAAAWTIFMLGVLLYYLRATGLIPGSFLTDWAAQLGGAVEMVLLSLALADRINIMRRDLAKLNGQLEQKVSELRDALSAAEAATRAKGEFLATVSHELRTPLNMIINIPQGLMQNVHSMQVASCTACGCEFMLEQDERVTLQTACPECHARGALRLQERREFVGSADKLAEHLGHIERSGKHLLDMVNGILDFSKLGAGRIELRPQRVDVNELLHELIVPLRELSRGSGVELSLEESPAQLEMEADPIRLKQVLINLIGNAIKFSDGRGTVRVAVQSEPTHLLFSVRDEGIGIAPDNLQRIFRSFEQVDQSDTRRFGGTGLGLAISKSLVEMHGGQIWVDSKVGAGSTFFVRLPKQAPENSNAQRAPAPGAPHAASELAS